MEGVMLTGNVSLEKVCGFLCNEMHDKRKDKDILKTVDMKTGNSTFGYE